MTITYEITHESSVLNILKFIYKNRNSIETDKDIKYTVKTFRDEIIYSIGLGDYTFIYNGNKLTISYREEGKPKGADCKIDYFKRLLIEVDDEKYFFNFINEVKTSKEEQQEDTLNVFVSNEYGEWTLYNKIPSRNMKNIYIEESIKEKLTEDITNFLSNEEEYRKFGIPYKKTYLLTGMPGSGKTSLIKAICSKFKFNLGMLSISKKFDNESLICALRQLPDKTFLLLEDIDSLFEKREATKDNPSITFSNLINILDGVLYKHSTVIFLTTNHPEKLDHALLRIGRVDMILQINYPSKKYIKNLFEDIINEETGFDKFYEYIKDKKLPMASLVNFLFRYRLEWEKNIDELVKTNEFIRKTLKKDSGTELYI
jgi:ATP-dependent Zn protease